MMNVKTQLYRKELFIWNLKLFIDNKKEGVS